MTKICVKEDDIKSKDRHQHIQEHLLLKGRPKNIDPIEVDLNHKDQIIDLFQRHQFQVNEEENHVISLQGGLARLRPPYRQFEANNVIVLDRLSTILDEHYQCTNQQMPSS